MAYLKTKGDFANLGFRVSEPRLHFEKNWNSLKVLSLLRSFVVKIDGKTERSFIALQWTDLFSFKLPVKAGAKLYTLEL